MVVVILGCWFVELGTMLEVIMGVFRCNVVIDRKLWILYMRSRRLGSWSLFATRDHVNI